MVVVAAGGARLGCQADEEEEEEEGAEKEEEGVGAGGDWALRPEEGEVGAGGVGDRTLRVGLTAVVRGGGRAAGVAAAAVAVAAVMVAVAEVAVLLLTLIRRMPRLWQCPPPASSMQKALLLMTPSESGGVGRGG